METTPPTPSNPDATPPRKLFPIKRNDAEALTRADVQFDLLAHIFHRDSPAVFTSQVPGQSNIKVNFCDLYVNALYGSSRCSKVVKDKMMETPPFAIELGKISLLTNVGRINTTMAFFPEMKAALRTYHPVPSLQQTDGNVQDAPRIKNCLKSALLPCEIKVLPPSTPEEIIDKRSAGQLPPTSVVNLIFVLATHAGPLGNVHFMGNSNFLDLFLPVKLSSASRARAFLFLMYHYLEDPSSPNPFADDHSRANPNQVPQLQLLSDEEFALDNVDLPEETEWGKMMGAQRQAVLQKLVANGEAPAHEKERDSHREEKKARPSATKLPERTSRRLYAHRQPQISPTEQNFLHYVPPPERWHPQVRGQPTSRAPPYQPRHYPPRHEQRTMLQHAWHVVTHTNPLLDSDEEVPMDEHLRLDYSRRRGVLKRLRGKSPTPDGALPSMT